jgi:hypothetical protein
METDQIVKRLKLINEEVTMLISSLEEQEKPKSQDTLVVNATNSWLNQDGDLIVVAPIFGSFQWPHLITVNNKKWIFTSQLSLEQHEAVRFGGKALYSNCLF